MQPLRQPIETLLLLPTQVLVLAPKPVLPQVQPMPPQRERYWQARSLNSPGGSRRDLRSRVLWPSNWQTCPHSPLPLVALHALRSRI